MGVDTQMITKGTSIRVVMVIAFCSANLR